MALRKSHIVVPKTPVTLYYFGDSAFSGPQEEQIAAYLESHNVADLGPMTGTATKFLCLPLGNSWHEIAFILNSEIGTVSRETWFRACLKAFDLGCVRVDDIEVEGQLRKLPRSQWTDTFLDPMIRVSIGGMIIGMSNHKEEATAPLP